MMSAQETPVLLNLMHSLDEAFLALQGLAPWREDDWGERFFTELLRRHDEWTERKTEVYMAANQLLHYFFLQGEDDVMGPHVCHNPAAFLRTIIMLLRNNLIEGQGSVRCPQAEIHEMEW